MPAPNFIDLTGQRFGRLLVECRDPRTFPDRRVRWRCLCDCGNTVTVRGELLRANNGAKRIGTQSCGCWHKEVFQRIITKHGKGYTPEYRIYHGMKKRCENPHEMSFPNYGGRGITVEWESFEQFLADMGPRPSPQHTIERVDNNGSYSKQNCIWLPMSLQARNTRRTRWIEFQGQRLTLTEVARLIGVARATIKYRLKHGLALSLPPGQRKPKRRIEFNGKQMTMAAIARELGLPYTTAQSRRRRGTPLNLPKQRPGPKKSS